MQQHNLKQHKQLKPSAIVFDLDGVVYIGSKPIAGVPQEISYLQKQLPILFLTNNSTKSRASLVSHLASFGITTQKTNVMTSSFGCAYFVLEKFGKGAKAFVIGESGLKEELSSFACAKLTESIDAEVVVSGLDRHLTYEKLKKAALCLNAGAFFLLANNDPSWPTEEGPAPGSGAIAASLIFATGRKPDFVVGKPSPYLLHLLLSSHKLDPKKTVFVGDRLDIDIRMANKLGMKSVLVLSGIAKKEDVLRAPSSDKPNFVIESAAELSTLFGF
ncbi:MAG: HAD-IIA family hydrolase [Candidatus Anstonellaceae archaeon]